MSLKKISYAGKQSDFKFKAPKLENINLGQTYAITLNPVLQPKNIDKKDVFKWYREQYDVLQSYKSGLSLQLWPEGSPIGRMHFHGYIIVSDIITYINFIKHMSEAYAGEVDTCEAGDKKFQEYVQKQQHIWQPFLKGHTISYPMYVRA